MRMPVKLPDGVVSFDGPVPSAPNRPAAVMVSGVSSSMVKESLTAVAVPVKFSVTWRMSGSCVYAFAT